MGVWHINGSITNERRRLLEEMLVGAGDAASVFVAADGTLEIRGELVLSDSGDRRIDVQQFLDENAKALGIGEPDVALRFVDAFRRSDDHSERLVYEQTWRDVPYYRCGVVVDVLGQIIRRVLVRVSTSRPDSEESELTRGEADVIAAERYEVEERPDAALVILDPYLMSGDDDKPRCAWSYRCAGEDSRTDVVVTSARADGAHSVYTLGDFGGVDLIPLPQYHLNPKTGVPDFVTFAPSGLHLPEASSGDPVSVALAFFRRLPLMFGRGDVPNQLVVRKVEVDDGPAPGRHVILDQIYAGIPVLDCELRVHLTNSLTIRSISGNYLRHPAVDVTPRVTDTMAFSIAATAVAAVRLAATSSKGRPLRRPKELAPILARYNEYLPGGVEAFAGARLALKPQEVRMLDEARADALDGAELMILPGDFPDVQFGTRLAWRVRFTEADIFINGPSGDPVFTIPNLHSARQIFNAGGAALISLLIPLLILHDGQTVGTPAATNTEIAAAAAGMVPTRTLLW